MDWQNALSRHREFPNVNTQNYTAGSTDKSSIWKQDDRLRAVVEVAAAVARGVNCGVTACAIDDQLHSLPLSQVMK
jgi:hypothetical protein